MSRVAARPTHIIEARYETDRGRPRAARAADILTARLVGVDAARKEILAVAVTGDPEGEGRGPTREG